MKKDEMSLLLRKLEGAGLQAGNQGEQVVKVSLTFEQSECLCDVLAFAIASI